MRMGTLLVDDLGQRSYCSPHLPSPGHPLAPPRACLHTWHHAIPGWTQELELVCRTGGLMTMPPAMGLLLACGRRGSHGGEAAASETTTMSSWFPSLSTASRLVCCKEAECLVQGSGGECQIFPGQVILLRVQHNRFVLATLVWLSYWQPMHMRMCVTTVHRMPAPSVMTAGATTE
jgi:hypothetical protein